LATGGYAVARGVTEAAAAANVALACGFVERFNPVVRTARLFLDEPPKHIVAVRHTPRNHRATANVIHELMIHDIDLAMQFGGGSAVDSVKGNTWTPPGENLIELADATIAFPSGLIATLSASRIGHREIRSFMLVTTNKVIELDLLRHHITITRQVSHEWLLEGGMPAHREQVVVDSPMVRHAGEPLAHQLEQFLDLVEGRLDPAAVRNGLLPPHTQAYKVEQS
jgi:predicted dehydrogenase